MQLHYGDYFPFFESDALNLFHCHSQVQVYCLTKLFFFYDTLCCRNFIRQRGALVPRSVQQADPELIKKRLLSSYYTFFWPRLVFFFQDTLWDWNLIIQRELFDYKIYCPRKPQNSLRIHLWAMYLLQVPFFTALLMLFFLFLFFWRWNVLAS